MRRNKCSAFVAIAGLAALLVLAACSVNVKKEANGQDKQVDIKTLVGGVHVSQQADVADVGLTVYPGARLKEIASKEKDPALHAREARESIEDFVAGLHLEPFQN